jgi:YegS/Rv2252/BmrU family lipid kinase
VSSERIHALIVNPSSGGGKGRDLLPKAENGLRERGLRFRTVVSESLIHGIDSARAAHDDGEVPVIMSGDGLVGQVGGSLAALGATIGILPGGRGNDLARVLDIPDELDGALDVLAVGNTRNIDVGEANGKRFLCIASMGFDSVANRLANEARLVRGNLVYAYAALRALASWKPATFTVTVDGEPFEFSGYAVAAANSKAFGGGMFIAPDAELDDGKLDVVCTAHSGKLSFLGNLPKVFKGTHVELEEVTVSRGAKVEVSADRDFAVYADGEHLTDLPATLGVLRGALRVIVP